MAHTIICYCINRGPREALKKDILDTYSRLWFSNAQIIYVLYKYSDIRIFKMSGFVF